MAYQGKAVANEFLKLAEREGLSLTPMKLQKLMYFAQGWYLAANDAPLIKDRIEAWQFGPVFPNVYHTFKRFGNKSVTERAKSLSLVNGCICHETPSVEDQEDQEFIKNIWDTYKGFSGVQLSNMTHEEGTPWFVAWNEKNGKARLGQDIDEADIRDYFLRQLNSSQS